jgi:hypothetical protein
MRPQLWQPPVALSASETAIVEHVHRAKLFVFLRQERHVLFSRLRSLDAFAAKR